MQVMYALDHLINLLVDEDPDELTVVLDYLRDAHSQKPDAPEPMMLLAYLFYLADASDYACGIIKQLQDKGNTFYRTQMDELIETLNEELRA
ncbi:MAG: hypothetical protein ACAI44_16615 [Candidatus Sericytochromatia bacterium]